MLAPKLQWPGAGSSVARAHDLAPPRAQSPRADGAARLRPWPARLRAVGLTVASWVLFGVLLGQQAYLIQTRQGVAGNLVHIIAHEVNYCLIWALLTPAIFRVGRAWPLVGATPDRPRHLGRALAVHLVASVVCALVVPVTQLTTVARLYPGWFPRPTRSDLTRALFGGVDYCFILYWIVTFLGQSLSHWRSLTEARVQKAELQEKLAAAQLQALQMQMHPHFLFNALNSVAELIHEDATAAERLVTELSELLRIYLRTSETQLVSLAQEVDFLRRYLEIQKLRFDDRLAVQITLATETQTAMVPSLILQPLVENAIVHGIADREHDGLVTIAAERQGASLVVRVADNGPGRGEPQRHPIQQGRGLRHTRARLEQLYGARHELSIEPVAGGGTVAAIRIPFRGERGPA
jgi:signal transduction histidine kinase